MGRRVALGDGKKKPKLLAGSKDPIAKSVAMAEYEKTLGNFDRFNEDFVTAYMAER